MSLPRIFRITMVRLATVMLLACQSIAVLPANAVGTTAPGESAAPVSCHDPRPDGGGSDRDHGSRCETKHGFSTPSWADVPSMDSLPPIVVRIDRLAAIGAAALPAASRPAYIEPPPLRILHCCLRN